MEGPIDIDAAVMRTGLADTIRQEALDVLPYGVFYQMLKELMGEARALGACQEIMTVVQAFDQAEGPEAIDMDAPMEVVLWEDDPESLLVGWQSNCYGLLVEAVGFEQYLYFRRGVPQGLEAPENDEFVPASNQTPWWMEER